MPANSSRRTVRSGPTRRIPSARAGQEEAELLPEYQQTVGPIYRLLRDIEGRQEGDPKRIAALIVKLANSEDVPVRLILGVDAEQRVKAAEDARATEAAKFRELTHSTVYPDAVSMSELLDLAKR